MEKQETNITVVCDGKNFLITNMVGKSVSYLKDFMGQQGYSLSERVLVKVFSMGPNEGCSSAIVHKEMGILPRANDSVFQILQGEILIVTGDYVLSSHDMVVQFLDKEGDSNEV